MSKVEDLQQMKTKVALTTDMWTSEANEAYLGVSYHYLTQDFELVSVCLAVENFSGQHTGVNIASGIRHILSNYAIDKSTVSAVIADNAANMDLALRLGEWRSRHCFGHTLQLAISDGLKMPPAVLDMIKSAKAIVAFSTVPLKQPKSWKNCKLSWSYLPRRLSQIAQHVGIVRIICSKGCWSKRLLSLWCAAQLEVREQAYRFQNGPCWRNSCKY